MNLNRMELSKKMKKTVNEIVNRLGYVSFVDVLLSFDKLSQEDYKKWRFGAVGYLERMVRGNLGQLNFLLKEYRSYCLQLGLKPSLTGYHSWGKAPKKKLQFSKSGNKYVEEAYATHFVRKNDRA